MSVLSVESAPKFTTTLSSSTENTYLWIRGHLLLTLVDIKSFALQDLRNVYSAFNDDSIILCAILTSDDESIVSLVSQFSQIYVVFYDLKHMMPVSRPLSQISKSKIASYQVFRMPSH